MTWTTSEIEDIIMKRPRLAVALLQILVQRTIEFTHRIESFSVDNIARRLARSLLRFSERLGAQEEDGAVRMVPFTHELLSQYVGTSREIVTHYMNQFRRRDTFGTRGKASFCITMPSRNGCGRIPKAGKPWQVLNPENSWPPINAHQRRLKIAPVMRVHLR